MASEKKNWSSYFLYELYFWDYFPTRKRNIIGSKMNIIHSDLSRIISMSIHELVFISLIHCGALICTEPILPHSSNASIETDSNVRNLRMIFNFYFSNF